MGEEDAERRVAGCVVGVAGQGGDVVDAHRHVGADLAVRPGMQASMSVGPSSWKVSTNRSGVPRTSRTCATRDR